PGAALLGSSSLGCLRRGLPEFVDLRRIAVRKAARDGPHLHVVIALVAVRARRLRRDAYDRARPDLRHILAEAHRQRSPRDDVDLLDLLVEMPGALLEVRVRRNADQRDRQLLAL